MAEWKHQEPTPEEIESLQAMIRELKELLIRYGEDRWAEQLDENVQTLRGVEKISGLHWPGMGGLHDLIICRRNGHRISANRERAVNKRLHDLMDAFCEESGNLVNRARRSRSN